MYNWGAVYFSYQCGFDLYDVLVEFCDRLSQARPELHT
jgi:hypothetical protein